MPPAETEMTPLNMDHFNSAVEAAKDRGAKVTKYQQAAWLIEDSMRGLEKMQDLYAGKTNDDRSNYIYHLMIETYVYEPLLWVYLLLTCFEVPLWCENGSWWDFSETAADMCPTPDGSHAYFSKMPYLPKAYASAIELVCIVVFLSTVGYKVLSPFKIRKSFVKVEKLRLVICCLLALDFGLFFFFNHVLNYNVSFRLSYFLRVALLFTGDTFRPACVNIYNMIHEFLNVAVLLFGTVLFTAWVAAMALDDMDDVENHAGQAINEGFEDLPSSIYTLFEASTTQNFPNQMLPTFIKYRWCFFPFMIFMVITVMIFLNLVLAVVYNAYSDSMTEQKKTYFKNRNKNIMAAFKLLQRNGEIKFDDFVRVISCLNRSPVVKSVTESDLDLYWHQLDADNSGAVDKGEFYDLCDILQYCLQRAPVSGWISEPSPEFNEWVRGKAAWGSWNLDTIINYVLVINSILVLMESFQDLGDFETSMSDNAWATVEFMFSWIYVAELCCKLCCISWKEYWADAGNKMDCSATLILFAVGVLWADPAIYISDETMRYFTILRLLRLVRLLAQLERFAFICTCIWKMLMASKEAIGLLFGILYIYATLGVMMFGGLIYDGNDALSPDGEDMDYRDSNYEILNFNDFGLGMVSLFVNLVTAFVPEFYEAFCAVSPTPWLAVMFWVSFYIIGVMVVFNVFASFIIDLFLAVYDQGTIEEIETEAEQADEAAKGYVTLGKFKGSDAMYKDMFLEDGDEEEDE